MSPTSRKQVEVRDFSQLVDRARRLAAGERRSLLGITGPPGAGKSTLADQLVAEIGEVARRVGMDGFHLSQARLEETGRLARKGAIDTFDGAGFVDLVRRLRHPGPEEVYAPEFQREREESIANALAIGPDVRLVVVEGNYLLVDEEPWSALAPMFDEVWYCDSDEARRLDDLIARHRAYGKSTEDARDWALGPDQRNAELVATTRPRADLILRLDQLVGGGE